MPRSHLPYGRAPLDKTWGPCPNGAVRSVLSLLLTICVAASAIAPSLARACAPDPKAAAECPCCDHHDVTQVLQQYCTCQIQAATGTSTTATLAPAPDHEAPLATLARPFVVLLVKARRLPATKILLVRQRSGVGPPIPLRI